MNNDYEAFLGALEEYDTLIHYGKGHLDGGHSGRYPWGSGNDPYQHARDFLSKYNNYKAENKSEREIADLLDIRDYKGEPSVKRLRARYSLAYNEDRAYRVSLAEKLYQECNGNKSEAARRLGVNESTFRSLLDENKEARKNLAVKTADILRDTVDKEQMIDVGLGSEVYLGVTQTRLNSSLTLLEEQGYHLYTGKIKQMGTDHETTMKVLCAPDISYGEFMQRRNEVKPVTDITKCVDVDGEVTALGLARDKIESVDSKRIMVRYNEEKGIEADGLIEIRPGLKDISLGASTYAQVRIPVDGTHYLKGMAVYNNNLPDGVDIVFNTNKHVGTPLLSDHKDDPQVLKPMKKLPNGEVDWDNPFGASVTPLTYTNKDGETKYSCAYIVNKEGDWLKWDRNIPSQMGSKQPISLIKPQLDQEYLSSKVEFDKICALTNNTVKRKLLMDFAEQSDASAVELKAAPFPGQQTHVLLPNSKVKENEIFAPNYQNGTVVALIRYPHASITEIPIVTVNNKVSAAKNMIGENAPDAVVVNYKTAQRLSGADFDGDTVAVIPLSDKIRVRNKPQLEELKNFDPAELYSKYPGMEVIKPATKQLEMGKVTNLITDMTLKGASDDQIAKALKHSMVIIDAEKHEYNWMKSEYDNDILALKETWQDTGDGRTGAGTIVSRAKSQASVLERKEWSPSAKSIDPKTGEKIYDETERTYLKGKLTATVTKELDPATGRYKTIKTYPEGVDVDEQGWTALWSAKDGRKFYLKKDSDTGKKVRVYVEDGDLENIKESRAMTTTTKMAIAKDAFELTSGGNRENSHPVEVMYAEYANKKKALANAARLEWLRTTEDVKDPVAAVKYKAQVESLTEKLRASQANAPLEREAQRIAGRQMAIRREANPDMTKEQEKKYKSQAINAARQQVGSSRTKRLIKVTDDEWEAIQAHAISPTKLRGILNNCDMETIRERATPRGTKTVTPAMKALARNLANTQGYTTAVIADRLGVSPTTISKILNGSI